MIFSRRLSNIAGLLGTISKWFGAVFLVPLIFAIFNGTPVLPFLVPMGVAVLFGVILEYFFADTDLERADGFLLVFMTWLGVSLLGAMPYVLTGTGTLALPLNAFFESVSGFSCTGSTVMGTISLDQYPHSVMIWRQLTQWLGGMGILVLAVAVLPRLSVGGAQFLDNEVPGPRMDRLTPHMAETARRLWLLYIGASAVLFVLLYGMYLAGFAPKMDAFQSLAHTLTTLPSGGFSPMGRSVEAFSAPVQWLLIPFMFVAAMNFALLWRAIKVGPQTLTENTEFKVYLWLFAIAGLVVSAMLLFEGEYASVEESFRTGFFQLATFITTTGFASADFAQWSEETMMVLIVLMFVSGCVGSTSGGLKIMRWIVGVKVVYREVIQRIHPSSVRPLRMGDRVLKDGVIRGAMVLIISYVSLFAISTVVVTIDTHIAGQDLQLMEVITACAATLGNIGPGLGAVGPMENFEFFPAFSKIWMCFLMIAGRLELMTALVLLAPDYWTD